MASADVKLGGAWAAFEQQQFDRETVIDDLCAQLAELTSLHQRLCEDYAQLQTAYHASIGKLQESEADLSSAKAEQAELAGQLETSKFLTEEMTMAKQDSITQLEHSTQQMQHNLASLQEAYQQQVHSLEQQNNELREIIAASMHTKRASTIKLETAMNALNLSKGNAARFIEELEAVKGKVEQLTGERDKAMAENVMVRQQRDCHANHCQLLTRDNKRLHTQLQTLRAEKSATEPLLVSTESRPVYSNIGKKSRAQTGRLSGGAQPADANQGNAAKSANSNPSRSFKGEDVQNTLHKDPFDLSKRIGKMSKTKFDSKSVLEQVQQLRSAVP